MSTTPEKIVYRRGESFAWTNGTNTPLNAENLNYTLKEIIQLADKRMYKAKSKYYVENKLDRRKWNWPPVNFISLNFAFGKI